MKLKTLGPRKDKDILRNGSAATFKDRGTCEEMRGGGLCGGSGSTAACWVINGG